MIIATTSAADVLQLVHSHHPAFDAIHTATALTKLAQLVDSSSQDGQQALEHPDFTVLVSLAEDKADTLGEQATGSVLSALATLDCDPSPELLSKLTAAVERNLKTFTAQGLANSLWGLATLDHDPGRELLGAVARQAASLFKISCKQVSSRMLRLCAT